MAIVNKIIKNSDKFFRPFKALKIKYDENALGFDDVISMEKREIIRQHYDSWHNPYGDIFEKEPRQDEYGLKKIVDELIKPKHFTNDKTILGLPINNIQKIHNFSRRRCNSYRGASLVDAPDWVIQKLKDEGIKTVIDVEGYGVYYKKRINKFGMDFISFSTDKYWNNIYLDKSSREFIEPFKKFIKAIKNDYFYIGCMMGTHKTDIAMTLGNYFNTNINTRGYQNPRYWGCADTCEVFDLYKSLTLKDKQELGLDKSFEIEFFKKFKNY